MNNRRRNHTFQMPELQNSPEKHKDIIQVKVRLINSQEKFIAIRKNSTVLTLKV